MSEWTIVEAIMETLSPLHLGTGGSEGNFHPTQVGLPGRTIRGMLGRYLYLSDRERFNEWSMDVGPVENPVLIFKPAFPVGSQYRSLSQRYCKLCGKSVSGMECPDDGHEGGKQNGLDHHSGITVSTKCPMDRISGTSPHGDHALKPHNIEAVTRGTRYSVTIAMKGIDPKNLEESLNEAGVGVGLGGFRSRGYGLVHFRDFVTYDASEYCSNIYGSINSELVDVVLQSPAIQKRGDYYRVGFDDDTLPGTGFNSKQAWIRRTNVRGWAIKGQSYGLIPMIPATEAGSTLRVTKKTLVENLPDLPLLGLGERQDEGFGHVLFEEVH